MYATNQRKGKSLHHVHIYREKDTKSTLQEVNTIQLFTLVLWTQVASKIVLELCFVDYFYVYALWYLLFFNHHRHKVVCMWVCVSNFDVNLFVQVINFSYWREYVNERFMVSPTFATSLSALLELTFWGVNAYFKMCMWALSIGYIYSYSTSNGKKMLFDNHHKYTTHHTSKLFSQGNHEPNDNFELLKVHKTF